jgi:hypothetical protein
MSNSKNTKESFLEEIKVKFPLLEIDTELTKVMSPDEVIELVNACVSFSGYPRNDIRNAFFRALSIPALDVYVDTDQRCKVAIDIVVNGLENRFPDKPKLEYEWEGESSNLSELRVIDKYGNGLFTEYWIAEPSELYSITEVAGAFELQDALEVPDVPEIQDAPEIHDASEVSNAPAIPNALEISVAPEVDSAHEVISSQIHNTPEDSDAVESADAPEIPGIPEAHDISEVFDDFIVGDASKESETVSEVPELVRSSPFPVKKRTKKVSEVSNNAMILEQILQELKEIKALLKDKQ